MTLNLADAIDEARTKVRKTRRSYMVLRYKNLDTGRSRYITTRTYRNAMSRTRIGESPLHILTILDDGHIWPQCEEFSSEQGRMFLKQFAERELTS